ncbi:hypothetical protein A1359_17455 [Methylomonas lenta]|uniref:Secreted protein n=1 Tax=Methylomonas lenta TaxID=980561 RepID=A0A177MWN6_9GAMM|nr:hypothetical protein [Methylomonas lenta]OAI09995.1 hypothetical protein A1359_17455 [Methylomonas lenta]
MRTIVFASALLLVGGFTQAIAQEPDQLACDPNDTATPVPASEVIAATVCVASGSGWEGQEYHVVGGELWDFKGGNDPANKSEPVGTWTNAGNQFTYNYGGTEYVTLYCRRSNDSIYFVNSAGRKQDVTFVAAGSGC